MTFHRYRLLFFWLTPSARRRLFHRLPKRWQESCWQHLDRETRR